MSGEPASTRPKSRLAELDAELGALRRAFHGWRIWYTPHISGAVTWEAQRLPLLRADKPDMLAAEMLDADEHYSREPCPAGLEELSAGATDARAEADQGKLRRSFPGWHIWYVTNVVAGGTTWCAMRHPALKAEDSKTLADQMLEVDERYSAGPYEADDTSPATTWSLRGTVPSSGL